MYLLFRYHHKKPSEIWGLPMGEKIILHAFALYEQKEREQEAQLNETN